MALIFTASFLAVTLLMAAVLTLPLSSRARVKKSLHDLEAYDFKQSAVTEEADLSYSDRVVWPILGKIENGVRRWNNTEQIARIQHKLILGGVRHITAEQFLSIKLGLSGAALAIGLLVLLPWLLYTGRSPWLGFAPIAIGFFLPDLWIERRIRGRQKQIAVALADSIDILTIGIEAGLTFDSAIAKITRNMKGPLAEEFGRMLGELQIGAARAEVLKNLGKRTTLPELQSFCATLVQADSLGVSIGKILKTEATELREKRRQAAEEEALKTPVKLVFPIVLCVLPALIVVIVGPGIIRILNSLF